ncbi:MAG: amidohydrolase family protein [Gemmatimonadota bacterium]|nr:amidohydrolase family protein [Gemmatimonadota bacterium]
MTRRVPAPVFVLLLILARALTWPGSLEAQSSPPLVLRGVNVVDGVSSDPLMDVSVVVEDGRIRRIGPADLATPPGAVELELRGYWVVPGLVDAHSHLNTLSAARRALESGVTTVRTAGVDGYADVAIRDAVRRGALSGPDILATGVYVTPDLGDGALADPRLYPFLTRAVETEDDLRLLVGVNADHGVDWIKTRGTERAGLPETDPREQVYSRRQLRAVVDAAAERGLRVAAHAHGDEGIRAAVMAGVTSVEHGTYASEETLLLMKERGTWLVPTLSSVLSFGQPGDYSDPALFLRGQHIAPRRVEMVARAYALGIPIVVGVDTDYGEGSTARVSRAVTFMVEELGFDPLYALQAATSRAARLLGVEERTGSVREGLEADLLVVDRNPLEHPRSLQDPLVIVSNGTVVVNRLPFGKPD